VGAWLRRACGMRLLPSLWFRHLLPATYDLRPPVCRLPSTVYHFPPFFSSTSFEENCNLFVFSNIVSSQQADIFSPFVFNNLQASLVYFGAPSFSSPWLRQYKLTLFISMIYILERFCISTANPFLFYNIVSSRGLLESFRLTLLAFHPHEQACYAPNLAKVGIFHPLRALCVLKPPTRRARSALRSPC
jgi:hypothetical protein